MNPAACSPVKVARRGLMLVLSSPSGAGKSTIARTPLDEDRSLEISVSVTTRAKRPSEIADKHYHFIYVSQFERMRDAGDLVDWAARSEEHTSELQSLMRNSYAVFCLQQKKHR